jgi:menaquinone-9 beta-reductase
MITSPPPPDVDVVIVGARCAGAATALLLARRGLRVLAVDRGAVGSDTLSTHALMRGAVVQLARWGVLPAIVAAGTPPVRRTTFDYDGDEVSVAISAKHGVDALYAPRRTVLDRVLVDAAIASGADVRHGMRVRELRVTRRRVSGVVVEDGAGRVHRVTARCVIGADGRTSTVARSVGARPTRVGRAMTATVYGHFPGIAVDGYRWMYRPGSSAGAVPTNDGATCVFVTVPAARSSLLLGRQVRAAFHAELTRLNPALAEATARSTPRDGLRGFGGQVGTLTACQGPGWALVGDAAYFKDPLTAHGITDALLHAELLANAVATGTDAGLAGYERLRTALARPVFDATEAIASFEWTIDGLRQHHTRLSRAMAAEIDEALTAFATAGVRADVKTDVASDVVNEQALLGSPRRDELAHASEALGARLRLVDDRVQTDRRVQSRAAAGTPAAPATAACALADLRPHLPKPGLWRHERR